MAVVPDSSSASVHSREAARWRYVKSVWSLRRRWYSAAIGSLTFSSRSAADHTSSAVVRMPAPAATYSSSGMDEPLPAPRSTTTWCPLRTSSCTPAGVMATRNSLFLTSRGMPTFTSITVLALRKDWLILRISAVFDGAAGIRVLTWCAMARHVGPDRVVRGASQSSEGRAGVQPYKVVGSAPDVGSFVGWRIRPPGGERGRR